MMNGVNVDALDRINDNMEMVIDIWAEGIDQISFEILLEDLPEHWDCDYHPRRQIFFELYEIKKEFVVEQEIQKFVQRNKNYINILKKHSKELTLRVGLFLDFEKIAAQSISLKCKMIRQLCELDVDVEFNIMNAHK